MSNKLYGIYHTFLTFSEKLSSTESQKDSLCDEFFKILFKLEAGNFPNGTTPTLIIIDDVIFPLQYVTDSDFAEQKLYFQIVARCLRKIIAVYQVRFL